METEHREWGQIRGQMPLLGRRSTTPASFNVDITAVLQ